MSTFISLVFCSNKRVFLTTHPVNTDTFYGPLAVSLLTGFDFANCLNTCLCTIMPFKTLFTIRLPKIYSILQSRQVKRSPQDSMIESVSRSRNWCQIQIGIPARVMSSEYFTRTSLYLVNGLNIFIYIKFRETELVEIS